MFIQRLGRAISRLLVFLLLVRLFPISFAQAATPTIVIGEVAWAGSSLSTADEWLELWNVSDQSVSLTGYTLEGAGGTSGISFGNADVVAPRSAFLVANYASTDPKTTLDVAPNVVTTAVSLPNDKLLIVLRDTNGAVIDQAGTGGTPPAGSSGAPKHSMIRSVFSQDGSDPSRWVSASTAEHFKPGATEMGTPGICDGCAVVEPPSAETTVATTTPPVIETPPIVEEPPLIIETPTSTASSTEALPVEPEASSTVTETTSSTIVEALPVVLPMSEEQASASTTESEATSTAVTAVVETVEPLAEVTTTTVLTVSTSTTVETDTTTTVPIIEEIASTSTNSVSSTEILIPLITASSTLTIYATSTAETTSTDQTPPIVRLHEIFPHPTADQEWFEVAAQNALPANGLEGWTVIDTHKTLFRFTSSTPSIFVSPSTTIFLVRLNGSRLRNDGDTIFLFDAQNNLVDQATYLAMQSDRSWIRAPDIFGEWTLTITPTPGQLNLATLPIVIVQTPVSNASPPNPTAPGTTPAQSTPTVTKSPTTTSTTVVSKPKISPSVAPKSITITKPAALPTIPPVKPTPTAQPPNVKPKAKVVTATKAKKTPTKTPAKKIVKVSTAKKTAPLIQSSSIPMLSRLEPATRVRLSGIVGSVPGLLSQNQFILQTVDGRGLLVQGNGKQPSPAFGTLVQLTGSLVTNDKGTSLRMLAADSWASQKGSTAVESRAVDLLAPSEEDAWSLVEVTGIVSDVKQTLVHVDASGTPLTVIIRPTTKYRTERLKTGDEIRLLGLLDTRYEDARIYPRNAEDITILHAASLKRETLSPTNQMSSWTPFGAAGITVAIAQGWKRFQKMRERKRLQKLLAQTNQDIQQLSSPAL